MPSLCRYLEIKDVVVWRTLEETFKKLGEKYLEDIHDILKQEVTSEQTKVFLLYVLGDIENTDSKKIFLNSLNHEESSVQEMALRGLYKLQNSSPLGMLKKFSRNTNSKVRRYLCFALQESDKPESLKLLSEFLADDDFQVRHAAFRILKAKQEEARPFLKEMKRRRDMLPSLYSMLDDILGLRD